MNYVDSFITVAEDCPVRESVVPQAKSEKNKSVAAIQYELLADAPYVYTQEDVLFQTYIRRQGIPLNDLEARGDTLREEFFSKPQPCLRTSPLARKFGWGFHCDRAGKVALYPRESTEYQSFAHGERGGPKVLKAFRSRRE